MYTDIDITDGLDALATHNFKLPKDIRNSIGAVPPPPFFGIVHILRQWGKGFTNAGHQKAMLYLIRPLLSTTLPVNVMPVKSVDF